MGIISSQSGVAHADYRASMTGTTQTEREIRWLWKYLYEFTQSCATSLDVCRDPQLRPVFGKLIGYLPAFDSANASRWAGLLEFVSEKDHPDLFSSVTGEAHRYVVTDTQPFSKVYINTDRMELPLQDWVGLLAHEATHHLGYLDDGSRLPDRVGAEIAREFSKAQISSLEQFHLPRTHAVTFNSEVIYHNSVGMISWGEWTNDVGWEPSPLQPMCDVNTERLGRQMISAASWRVNRLRVARGLVTVRGGGYVRTVCLNRATGARRQTTMPLLASFDLQYPAPLDLDHWMDLTPTQPYDGGDFSASVNPQDHIWGMGQTFLIVSNVNERTKINAGEVWNVKIVLRSIDAFRPDSCLLFVAGSQYSYIKRDNLPGINPFDSCKLTALPGNQWQVEGSVRIPVNARPDRYYIPMVQMSSVALGDRVAIPTYPTLIEVANPGAPPPPVVHPMEFPGLVPVHGMGTLDLTNSYRVEVGQKFTVEFVVDGPQTLHDLWLDLTFWYPNPVTGELLVAGGTGSSSSMPGILIGEEYVPVTGGGTRVKVTFQMPASISTIQLAAIKFNRFYVRTSDYSWAEVEAPGFHDTMVVISKYAR